MSIFWISAFVTLWVLVLVLAFLLVGVLRNVGLLTWRLEQLEATTPSRLGRSGLAPGKKAPDFTLASVHAGNLSLDDLAAGRKTLLVFVQARCGPCHDIVPELNKFADQHREIQVIAINHATPDEAREFVTETGARFSVLIQEDWAVSKRYEVFATPFAFLLDERRIVAAKGIITQPHHLGYLLSAVAPKAHASVDEDLGAVVVTDEQARADEIPPVVAQP